MEGKGVKMVGPGRGRGNTTDLGPGPGAYSFEEKYRGGAKFGTEARDKNGNLINDAPGPGNYNSPSYMKAGKGKGITFGVKPKNKLDESMPGPGAYSTGNLNGDGPKFSMGGRKEGKNYADGPGPGNYEPHINASKPRAPGVAMGKGGRT